MTRSTGWLVAGVALVGAGRLLLPSAPALYDGLNLPQEPFHYCNPPSSLASTNKAPGSGSGDLQVVGTTSQLGSVNTADNQVLTFFPKGALAAPGATSFHVTIKPNCHPPAAPPPNKIVGNAYDIQVTGQPGDLPVRFLQPAQMLLRVPPYQYSSVQNHYDGTWHGMQWNQQGDIANTVLDHPGTVAALDDGRGNPPGKTPNQFPGLVYLIEALLVAAALGIVGAAIAVQRRRGRQAGKARNRRR